MIKRFISWLRQPHSESVTFLVWAPPYTNRSSGIRALYRLCHHLNNAGFSCAILLEGTENRQDRFRPSLSPKSIDLRIILSLKKCLHTLYRAIFSQGNLAEKIETPPGWKTPFHDAPIGDSIVIYPEVVFGNPFKAKNVVRWALNNPGLISGDTTYPDDEMVFVYDSQRLDIVSEAVSVPLTQKRVLWMGLIDPTHIYPDTSVQKTIDCSFTHKGYLLKERFPLPLSADIIPLEQLTPTMDTLGDTLRRTRVLYSYDHYSNVLREAIISGCEVRVMGEDGQWHDPQTCQCSNNILWTPDFNKTYAAKFHSSSFVKEFISEIKTRWPNLQTNMVGINKSVLKMDHPL